MKGVNPQERIPRLLALSAYLSVSALILSECDPAVEAEEYKRFPCHRQLKGIKLEADIHFHTLFTITLTFDPFVYPSFTQILSLKIFSQLFT